MRQWTAAPLLGAALLCLSACSGASPAPATVAAGTQASSNTVVSTTSASPSPTSASSTSPAAKEDAHKASAADVCAFLTSQIPALEAISTPVGRQANLTGNLYGFFQSHHEQPDGSALDETTRAKCPDVRARILTLTGLTSLQQL